ncbi:MAG: thiamine pyrophosphate-dependent enzyme, partial [Ghiorsea sp.]|nr:thiamine pyrophosphate-dependent enzyme [Ghiorsea sp.]
MPKSQNKHISMTSHQEALAKLKHDMRINTAHDEQPPIVAPSPAEKPQAAPVKQAQHDESSHETTTALHHVEYPSRALYLINAWRMHGHLKADLDPLKLNPPHIAPDMELAYYGLSEHDLNTDFPTGDLFAPTALPLKEIINILDQTYSGHIAPELMHVSNTAKRNWLQQKLESSRSKPQFNNEQRKHIFNMVMKAEEFERFLHTRYTGQKRFSLEGGESLIPMLDSLIQRAGNKGVKEIIVGMAHRGRLNVLANVLGKSLSDIFAEFEGNQFIDTDNGAGDVKYHNGFSSDINTDGGTVHLSLGFNPSHLEIITPVVLGSVRARQCRRKDNARREVMGVLIHGDAAFAGQGIVAESLNLGDLSGYRT